MNQRSSPSCLLALISLLILSGIIGADEVTFTKITTGPVAATVSGAAAAWGDYNNDGWIDLYVTTLNGPSFLYSNNGNGTFTSIAGVPIAAGGVNSFGCVWGDYDNDGWLDLFQGGYNQPSRLFHNNGNGTFGQVTATAMGNVDTGANNVLWADYDNDSYIDMLLVLSFNSPKSILFHNNGDGTFTRIADSVVDTIGNSEGASWGDYDNDGLLDLVVDQTSGPSHLYHNNGNGNFTEISNNAVTTGSGTYGGAAWGDYDNDGLLDLFVSSYGQHSALYHNDGNGSFTRVTNTPIYQNVAKSTGGAWADYDNDGWLDLFVGNDSGAKSFLYHNNGDGTFTAVTNGIVVNDLGTAQGAAWGDYNNDGFMDLFVPNIRTYNSSFYRNNGNSNSWLMLKLDGRISNRAAIGAKVRVKATIGGREIWQFREISGGGSLGSQNDLRAGFGLADATNASVVRIEWPSGIVQELRDVGARQFLTVAEPEVRISPAGAVVEQGGNVVFTIISTLPGTVNFQWKRNGTVLPGETNTTLVLNNVQANDIGKYNVSVSQVDAGTAFATRAASLTGPVAITQPPLSQNVGLGSNLAFQVVATGAGLLTYQWFYNGTPLAGAIGASLIVSNAQLVHQGNYSVTVSNSYGAVPTADAAVIVLIKPRIIRNPVSQTVVAGGTVTLSVSAEGNPLPMGYRWRRNLITQTNIVAESTNGFYTVTNLQATDITNLIHFIVIVTNLAGTSAFSADAVVTVLADTDRDGIPDDWEIAFGLNPTDPGDALLDSDGDGVANLQEYRAGTDPRDKESYLRIESISALDPGSVTIQFMAGSNRTYTVEWCADIPAWIRLADIAAEPANRPISIVHQHGVSAANRFYRLVSPRQP